MNNDHPAWRSPLHAIRDRITFASSAEKLRRPAFHTISALQQFPPEVQMDALFLTAVAMADSLGLDAHDMVTRAKRILPEAEGPFSMHVQAVRDYARGELRR